MSNADRRWHREESDRLRGQGRDSRHPTTANVTVITPAGADALDSRRQLGIRRVAHLDEGEAASREHREGAAPLPAVAHRGRTGSVRLASPTATQAPTRARTMLWQNASARTRATSTPSSSLVHANSCRVRIVVAPGRGLQYAAKSWRPEQRAGRGVHRLDVEGGRMRARRRGDGVPQRDGIRDPVLVAAPDGGEPGIEAGRCDSRRATCTSPSRMMPVRRRASDLRPRLA